MRLPGFPAIRARQCLKSSDRITLPLPRAKGLPERVVIYRHALRNALLPIITILGFSLPGLIGGSVIFETIFAIPGMGQLFYQGVMSRDYPLVMGILVIGAFLTLIGNLLADLALCCRRSENQTWKSLTNLLTERFKMTSVTTHYLKRNTETIKCQPLCRSRRTDRHRPFLHLLPCPLHDSLFS